MVTSGWPAPSAASRTARGTTCTRTSTTSRCSESSPSTRLRLLEKGQRVILSGKLKVRHWEANGRTGTSVDLEAMSIGPDLMFGVATFVKDGRAAESSGNGPDARAPRPPTSGRRARTSITSPVKPGRAVGLGLRDLGRRRDRRRRTSRRAFARRRRRVGCALAVGGGSVLTGERARRVGRARAARLDSTGAPLRLFPRADSPRSVPW